MIGKRKQFPLENKEPSKDSQQTILSENEMDFEEEEKMAKRSKKPKKRRISRLVQVQVHGEHSNINGSGVKDKSSHQSLLSNGSDTAIRQHQTSIMNGGNSDDLHQNKYQMYNNHKFVKQGNDFLNFVGSPGHMSSIQSGTTGIYSTNTSKIHSNSNLQSYQNSDQKKRYDHKGNEIRPNGKHGIKFHNQDKLLQVHIVENWKEYNNVFEHPTEKKEKKCCILI